MNAKRVALGLVALALLAAAGAAGAWWLNQPEWTAEELATIRSLWLDQLGPPPPDPSNAVADDPEAAALGRAVFFDARFSANGRVSCATCHQPGKAFTDGLPQSRGVGAVRRNAPTLVGVAHSAWQFWDGRKDSVWAQALGPLEDANEHGGNRTQYAHLIYRHHRDAYEAVFGPLPPLDDAARFPPSAGPVADAEARAAWEAMDPADRDAISRVYANLGKAIAAFVRRIQPGPARFDAYVAALVAGDAAAARAALDAEEKAGLRLFIGKGNCTQCHNGPLLANHDFHSTGTPPSRGVFADRGRADGIPLARDDEFNCLSGYSDAAPERCLELRFLVPAGPEHVGAFKTPTLRNVAETAPYMHAGQLATLEEVLDHYNEAPPGPHDHTDLVPLNLSARELDQLLAYLNALSGPVRAP